MFWANRILMKCFTHCFEENELVFFNLSSFGQNMWVFFMAPFYIYPETVAKVKFERNLRKNPGYKGGR